jgi:uncharacterized phage-associated protein
MVRLPFNEAKLTQAAASLLKLGGGKMNYMKLIKLLYLADRRALLQYGRPITTDCYVSMDKGPVLSRTLEIIHAGKSPSDAESPWFEHISPPQGYEVSLLKPCPNDELSPAEEDVLAEVFAEHGGKNQWQLVDLVHTLPEWHDPHGSASPIGYDSILLAGDIANSEVSEIIDELRQLASMHTVAVGGETRPC